MTHRTFGTAHIFGTCLAPFVSFLSFPPTAPTRAQVCHEEEMQVNVHTEQQWHPLSLGCCETAHAIHAGITTLEKSLPGQASAHPELGATTGVDAFVPPSPPTRHGIVTCPEAVSQWPRVEKSGHPWEKTQLLTHQVIWWELQVNLHFIEKDALFLYSVVLDFLVTVGSLDLKPPRKELGKS